MTDDNQTNLNENDTFVNEEDTEISVQPPAPNFGAAEAAPVQPVIPVAAIPADSLGAYPQQPQVVYVAQPTAIQPKRNWGWIPVALVLLLVATVVGAFVGAELYKRSIYAESSAPNSSDVSPYANSTENENKSLKSGEHSSLTDKEQSALSENAKSADGKSSESKEINSISTGFAPIQRTEVKGARKGSTGENDGEENNQETAEAADEDGKTSGEEKKAEKTAKQSESEDEDEPPPPPVQRKSKELPKKVENVKDTQNIPPTRALPN